ncbi:MAG TPA: RNA methyltransferase, partial [Sphingobacteriaceae bacterium]|nr:RNA methyltransferase [Sphingobacteriaceae bacterium]
RPSIQAFKDQEKLKVTLLLDDVRSLQNVGSIFRTADGFAVEEIILCGITGQPPHRDIERAALGATQSVDWRYEKDILKAIAELKKEGYKIVAVEQAEGSTFLNKFYPLQDKKYALIFGNEVNGVSEEVMAEIDKCIEIPQFGTKHSFNIVVSAGIILWDFYSKLNLRS